MTELRYYPFGGTRYDAGGQLTAYRYTGQRVETGGTGLYDYGARWYDPVIGRFIQADTIIPDPGDPQSLNRYSYVSNNPLKYTDPTGHRECEDRDCKKTSPAAQSKAKKTDLKLPFKFDRVPIENPTWAQGYGPNDFAQRNPNIYAGTSGLHGGIDLGSAAGTLVYAGVKGTIVNSSSMNRDASPNVVVYTADGYYVTYGHVDVNIKFQEDGTQVNPDDVIGTLDSQQIGDFNNSHLHLAVITLENGQKRNHNPLIFFPDNSPAHDIVSNAGGYSGSYNTYSISSFMYRVDASFWDNPLTPALQIGVIWWK